MDESAVFGSRDVLGIFQFFQCFSDRCHGAAGLSGQVCQTALASTQPISAAVEHRAHTARAEAERSVLNQAVWDFERGFPASWKH